MTFKRKLLKFIKENRKNGISQFQILTTADELIIIAVDFDNNKKDSIRLYYK